jgi:hypothetical protein
VRRSQAPLIRVWAEIYTPRSTGALVAVPHDPRVQLLQARRTEALTHTALHRPRRRRLIDGVGTGRKLPAEAAVVVVAEATRQAEAVRGPPLVLREQAHLRGGERPVSDPVGEAQVQVLRTHRCRMAAQERGEPRAGIHRGGLQRPGHAPAARLRRGRRQRDGPAERLSPVARHHGVEDVAAEAAAVAGMELVPLERQLLVVALETVREAGCAGFGGPVDLAQLAELVVVALPRHVRTDMEFMVPARRERELDAPRANSQR